jgi:hypothetical protein
MGCSVTLTSAHVPAHIAELLGPAPLLEGEDPKQYQALLSEIARAVKPIDVMEWLPVKDVVDLTWDTLRYRRLKAKWIQHNKLEAPNLSSDKESYSHQLSPFEMATSAFASLNLIEQMQASAELRRNNALREIESRRSRLGQALRQTSDKIIEAEATPALAKAS